MVFGYIFVILRFCKFMENNLFASKFLNISFDKENQIIYHVWKIESRDMDFNQYQLNMLAYIDILQTYQPKRVLADMRNFNFVMTQAIQKWSDLKVNEPTLKLGVKKIAIVVSTDIQIQLGIEEAIDDKHVTSGVLFNYFDEPADAKVWLML